MAESGIYEIVNLVNGKRYVGSAVDPAQRWREHRWALRRGDHANIHLCRAWTKHGENKFVFRVLEHCSPELLIEREQSHIDSGADYNICPTAGSTLGRPHSHETRRKIGQSKVGLKMPPRSPEHSANLSAAIKRRPPNPERNAKMAATKRGRSLPDEHKAKIAVGLQSAWDSGKRSRTKSPEHRAKIAATLRGRKATPEHRANQSAAQLGRKRGPYKRRA